MRSKDQSTRSRQTKAAKSTSTRKATTGKVPADFRPTKAMPRPGIRVCSYPAHEGPRELPYDRFYRRPSTISPEWPEEKPVDCCLECVAKRSANYSQARKAANDNRQAKPAAKALEKVAFKPLTGRRGQVEKVRAGKTFIVVRRNGRLERYHWAPTDTCVAEAMFATMVDR